jgi:hypothetical protein
MQRVDPRGTFLTTSMRVTTTFISNTDVEPDTCA